MPHVQLRLPPDASGPPWEADLWPSAPIWPTWASQSDPRRGLKQLTEIDVAVVAELWLMGDYVCDVRCFLTHRILNPDKTSETAATAQTHRNFPFVRLIYMLDLKLIMLMMNPALVLASVWFYFSFRVMNVQTFDVFCKGCTETVSRSVQFDPHFFGLKIGLTFYFFMKCCGLFSFKKH